LRNLAIRMAEADATCWWIRIREEIWAQVDVCELISRLGEMTQLLVLESW
jgi:hypothetical protein